MLVNRSQLILEAGLGLVRVESLATDTRHNWASHFASPIFFGFEIILTPFVLLRLSLITSLTQVFTLPTTFLTFGLFGT